MYGALANSLALPSGPPPKHARRRLGARFEVLISIRVKLLGCLVPSLVRSFSHALLGKKSSRLRRGVSFAAQAAPPGDKTAQNWHVL